MNNHSVFMSLFFFLLCCECGCTDEPVTNTKTSSITELAIDTESKAIEAIKILGGKIARDDTGNVIQVDFFDTNFSDTGFEHLKGLTRLTNLDLSFETKVTKEGVMKLEAAIPNCKIKH